MTLKINVGCVSLASEMNGGNIRLRMTLKINVGCLSLAFSYVLHYFHRYTGSDKTKPGPDRDGRKPV